MQPLKALGKVPDPPNVKRSSPSVSEGAANYFCIGGVVFDQQHFARSVRQGGGHILTAPLSVAGVHRLVAVHCFPRDSFESRLKSAPLSTGFLSPPCFPTTMASGAASDGPRYRPSSRARCVSASIGQSIS